MILPETHFQRRQGDFILLKACRRASPPAVPLPSVPSVLWHALRAARGAALPEIDSSEMPERIAQMTPAAQPPATEKRDARVPKSISGLRARCVVSQIFWDAKCHELPPK